MESRDILDAPQSQGRIEYAGFWLRFAALFIDGIILAIPVTALQYLMLGSLFINGEEIAGQIEQGEAGGMITRILLFYLVSLTMYWLYFALQEASPRQATLGKRAVNIKVTDEQGERIAFGRASGRYFGKILSAIILYIGFIMAAFTERRQALHDILAKTLVVKAEN